MARKKAESYAIPCFRSKEHLRVSHAHHAFEFDAYRLYKDPGHGFRGIAELFDHLAIFLHICIQGKIKRARWQQGGESLNGNGIIATLRIVEGKHH